MSDRPHAFTLTTPAGEECQDCGVTVESEHLIDALTVPCPAVGCQDPANRGEACVFVASDGKGHVECSYCERPGDPEGRYGDDDTDMGWFYALDDTDDTSEGLLDNFEDDFGPW